MTSNIRYEHNVDGHELYDYDRQVQGFLGEQPDYDDHENEGANHSSDEDHFVALATSLDHSNHSVRHSENKIITELASCHRQTL